MYVYAYIFTCVFIIQPRPANVANAATSSTLASQTKQNCTENFNPAPPTDFHRILLVLFQCPPPPSVYHNHPHTQPHDAATMAPPKRVSFKPYTDSFNVRLDVGKSMWAG